MGEYRVMGIYPKGHVMEFVRPRLRPEVLPAAAVEDGARGGRPSPWRAGRWHGSTRRGKSGTVFVTVEDETGRRATHPVAAGVRPVQEGA